MIERIKNIRAPKSVLFYLLGIYVLIQFCWWAYMLVDLNAEIYQLRLELLQQSVLAAPEQVILKGELDQKLSLRIWMVLGEGAVFVIILLLGLRSVRNSINKELRLASQQKNFLLSVTHELKSPLASVKLQLQTLARPDLPKDKAEHLYTRALNDANRLEKLVENLLLVNKVESGTLPVSKSPIALDAFVSRVTSAYYADELADGKLLVQNNKATVAADEMALESVLINLVDNAIKYGNGSNVLIDVNAATNQEVELRVSDNGQGIPDDEKDKVFQRFYRVGNEDVRKTKGTGIGLYLVKLLVLEHQGKIQVYDNKPAGSVFAVTLPTVSQ